MKKKLMMVAVLLGALSLGACVDDNESASVTNIRNAKAQQLTALAALSNAQAEAATIVANAEAAYKQAQAAYQQALANSTEAETERLNAEHAIELEKLRAQAEVAIAKAKYNAADWEQKLLDMATERVRELYAEYKVEVNSMYTLQETKITYTNNLAQAEAGLIPAEDLAQITIDAEKKRIAENDYEIGLYAEYEGADLVELKQELMRAEKEANLADDAEIKADDAQQEANNAYIAESERFYTWYVNDVQNPLATVEAANELQNNGWNVITTTTKKLSDTKSIPYYTLTASNVEREQQNLENNVKYYTDLVGKTTDKADANGSLNAQLNYWKEQKADLLEADETADVTFEQGRIDQLTADITTNEGYLTQAEERLELFNTLIASFSGEDLTAYDAAVTAITGLAEAYEKAYDEYIVARDNSTKADQEVTSLNNLIDQTDVEQRVAELEKEKAECQNRIVKAQNDMADLDKQIAQYEAKLTNIEDQIIAQQAIIDSLKQQIEAAINESDEDTTTPETPAEETPAA